MAQRAGRPNPDDEDNEGPSAADIEQFSDVTRKCPKCSAEMYDDVQICWKCGHALEARDRSAPPKWVVAVIGLLILGFVLFSIRGC